MGCDGALKGGVDVVVIWGDEEFDEVEVPALLADEARLVETEEISF